MKEAVVNLPFFMNKDNMEYLMKGYKIKNFDQIEELIFAEGNPYVYKARSGQTVFNAYSEYPNDSDQILGKVFSSMLVDGKSYLTILLYDTLTYSMISNPCIKVNGYCTVGCEDGQDFIIIDKVTRLTIADRNSGGSDLYIPSVKGE